MSFPTKHIPTAAELGWTNAQLRAAQTAASTARHGKNDFNCRDRIESMGQWQAEQYRDKVIAWREAYQHASETGQFYNPVTHQLIAEFTVTPDLKEMYDASVRLAGAIINRIERHLAGLKKLKPVPVAPVAG